MNKISLRIKQGTEFIKELVLVVLSVLLIITFLLSHNKIPTASMVSTININDHILVSMVPYYYRDPERGEIVVFKHGNQNWVKRTIGLPGDVIDIRDGKVYINDEPLDECAYLAEGMDSTPADNVIDEDGTPLITTQFPYTVPEGYYFLMGDNRENSKDSRYIGPVKRDLIYGKAWAKIYPFNAIGILK